MERLCNKDWTISHVGMAGHMAYQSATMIGDQRLIRIDYEKFYAEKIISNASSFALDIILFFGIYEVTVIFGFT